MNRRQGRSIRRCNAQNSTLQDSEKISPVEPMHQRENTPVQPEKTPKTLTSDKSTHRLIRCGCFQNVGSTGAGKNSVRVQRRFSSPRSLENLMILRSKLVQRSSNFGGDEDNDFKNTSPKDFNESPHGLRGIERKRSKSEVFSRDTKSTRTLILKSS